MATRAAALPPVAGDRRGSAIVLTAICSLIYLLDGLVHTIIGPLAPEIARSLALSRADLGPVFSANLLGQCVGLVVIPLAVRHVGHRNIVVASLVGFGLVQAATAFAGGRDGLIALRVVTGFFLGGALPSCFALLVEGTPPVRRGLVISILFTGYGGGAIAAGLIASVFTGAEGWRVAMAVVGGVCLVAALVSWGWLSDSGRRPVGEVAASGDRAREIVGPRYLVGTLMLWIIFIAMLTINYCLSSWLPTLLADVGRGKAFAALSVSTFAAGGVVATLATGPLIDRFGARNVLMLFLAISAATLFTIGQVLRSASPATLMALLVAGGFFSLGSYGGVNVVLSDYYPAGLRAVGVGWTKSIGRLGTVIAPVLIGLGLSAGVAHTTVMSLFAVPAAVTMAAMLVIDASMRRNGGLARRD